jgi:nucleoside-diphosphate-sugar epimerase
VNAGAVAAGAVLVTGAGGFIGRALCDAFRARGLEVVGVDLVGDGKDVVAGSVENPAPWEHLLDRVQLVVHTAALVTNAMPDDEMWRGNVLATRNLVAACVRRKVQRFVHVSSIVVYGNSAVGELDEEHPVHADGGSYVTTKLAAEHVVLAACARDGLDVVIVRPGDVYGPASRPWVIAPIELIRSRQFLLPAGGEACFRPVYIDDLVRGVVAASLSDRASGQIFNLSSDGYVTTKEFFAHHHRWLGQSGPLCLPTPVAWTLAESTWRVKALLGVRSEGSGASVLQLTSRAWFSIRKAADLLGWKPEVGLEDGMKRSEDWARSKGLL